MIHIIRLSERRLSSNLVARLKALNSRWLSCITYHSPFMQSTALTNNCITKQSDSQVSWPSPFGPETVVCYGSNSLINFFISMMTVFGEIISYHLCVL